MTPVQIERFWRKVRRRANAECWCWLGARTGGFPHVRIDYRNHSAIRIAWLLVRPEPLPAGLKLRRLCRNRTCVNPWHGKPAPQGEIVRAASRRVCKREHPQTPANVYYNGRRHRRCRLCERLLARGRRARPRPSVRVAEAA